MTEVIAEVWCSPLRSEIYNNKMICISDTEDHWISDELTDYFSWLGDFWYDIFGEEYKNIGGLYKVVFKLSIDFVTEYDWEGLPETVLNIFTEAIFKSKCSSIGELKYQWLTLQGEERVQRYNEKVIMKALDKYLEE